MAEQQGQEWHPYAVAADRIVYRRRDGTEGGDVVWFGGNRIRRDEVLVALTNHDRLVHALEAWLQWARQDYPKGGELGGVTRLVRKTEAALDALK